MANAGQPDSDGAIEALESLLRRYYRPLQAHLAWKFAMTGDAARDALQEFVQRRVLLANLLASAARDKGRFRTFLLTALDHFVVSEFRRESAAKRRPAGGLCSLDELEGVAESSGRSAGPDACVESWAEVVIEQVLELMKSECQSQGCLDRWGIFKERLLDPVLNGADAVGYEDLIARYGFRTPSEASNALITAKRMFNRLLRQVVSDYAGQGADVEEEIRELRQALARAR